jgi:hypothetical protein
MGNVGESFSVVATGHSDCPAFTRIFGKIQKLVGGTPDLERAGYLKVFQFKGDPRAE